MPVWDKTAITPGTKFMKELGSYITNYYKNSEKRYNISTIIVSTSDVCGEGEHKILNYIKKNNSENYYEDNDNLIIY